MTKIQLIMPPHLSSNLIPDNKHVSIISIILLLGHFSPLNTFFIKYLPIIFKILLSLFNYFNYIEIILCT